MTKHLFALLIFLCFCSFAHADELTIADYYRLLPKVYQDYYADAGEARLETDIRNGYLAIFAEGRHGPLFEMALFRDAEGGTLLLVTNVQSDPACLFYQSHALRYRDNTWREQNDILPRPKPEDFFSSPEDSAVLQKAPDYVSWRYRLPRYGTELQLAFGEPCDKAEGLSAEDYARFVELRSDKIQRFHWNKDLGEFVP